MKRGDVTGNFLNGYSMKTMLIKTPSPIRHRIRSLGENIAGQGHWVSLSAQRPVRERQVQCVFHVDIDYEVSRYNRPPATGMGSHQAKDVKLMLV